jgi:uncharacterized membrane protein
MKGFFALKQEATIILRGKYIQKGVAWVAIISSLASLLLAFVPPIRPILESSSWWLPFSIFLVWSNMPSFRPSYLSWGAIFSWGWKVFYSRMILLGGVLFLFLLFFFAWLFSPFLFQGPSSISVIIFTEGILAWLVIVAFFCLPLPNPVFVANCCFICASLFPLLPLSPIGRVEVLLGFFLSLQGAFMFFVPRGTGLSKELSRDEVG